MTTTTSTGRLGGDDDHDQPDGIDPGGGRAAASRRADAPHVHHRVQAADRRGVRRCPERDEGGGTAPGTAV